MNAELDWNIATLLLGTVEGDEHVINEHRCLYKTVVSTFEDYQSLMAMGCSRSYTVSKEVNFKKLPDRFEEPLTPEEFRILRDSRVNLFDFDHEKVNQVNKNVENILAACRE